MTTLSSKISPEASMIHISRWRLLEKETNSNVETASYVAQRSISASSSPLSDAIFSLIEKKKKMMMMLHSISVVATPSSSTLLSSATCSNYFGNLKQRASLPKTLFPKFECDSSTAAFKRLLLFGTGYRRSAVMKKGFLPHASLIETPVLWAGRLCVFYALLKAGLAGSQTNPIVAGMEGGVAGDTGFAEWIQNLQGNPDKEASDKRKLVSKWHPTTKGSLKRNYRVPSKTEGRRLLRGIAALLSEDDHFVDASSHKGCQIRRESAHGESVCCNNVRARFDELPTPHVIVEITAFPAGPLTDRDYVKAEKLERVLRSGPNI